MHVSLYNYLILSPCVSLSPDYWDSYFIVKGLLVSGMVEMSKGMVENLLDDVKKYGFVPNGSRIYYLNRSQPPLLSEMVMSVFKHTVSKS